MSVGRSVGVGRLFGRSALAFIGVCWRFLHYCSCPIAQIAFFITAPAHPHATSVAVYTALFYPSSPTHSSSPLCSHFCIFFLFILTVVLVVVGWQRHKGKCPDKKMLVLPKKRNPIKDVSQQYTNANSGFVGPIRCVNYFLSSFFGSS